MEATRTSENAKAAERGFKDTNTAITDMYSKQVGLVTGFYTNFFNSMMGGNKGWSQDNGYNSLLQNNDLTKLFSNPFSGSGNGFQNPFLHSFEKVYSQLANYNRDLFTGFKGETQNPNADLNEISRKYKDTIDSRLEASKNVLKSATDAYNKQFDSAVETNRKMMDEMNVQFDSVVKQTQKFWSDVLHISDVLPDNKGPLTEQDLNVKEPTPGELKRKSTVPASEFMDHKA